MISAAKEHMIFEEVNNFLTDRKLRSLSKNTLNFYSWQLTLFLRWCAEFSIESMEQINPDVLRRYLLQLGKTRNPRGVHAMWRTLKVFLRWWESDAEPENWRNPITKVPPPKINTDPIEGISLAHFAALVDTCDRDFLGLRDRAIFMALLDTGMRMAELLALNVEDVDLETGSVVVKHGKGNKKRIVFLGIKARRDLVRYMRARSGLVETSPVFVTRSGTRFKSAGLRQMVINRAKRAGIPAPGLHDFRRTFTIQSLRNGADVLSISRTLGHSNVHLVERYAKQTTDDLRMVHEATSPVDNI